MSIQIPVVSTSGAKSTVTLPDPVVSAVTPAGFTGVTNRLASNQSATIQIIGDSTAMGVGSTGDGRGWAGQLATLLGNLYDANVVYSQFQDASQAYQPLASMRTSPRGTGAPTLTVWNGSWGGKTLAYYDDPVRRPKLLANSPLHVVLIADGINDALTPAQFSAAYLTFVNNVKAFRPGVPIIATTQNPQVPTTSDNTLLAKLNAMISALNGQAGVSILDTRLAYTDPATQIGADGVHPTQAGYVAQANWMLAQFTSSASPGLFFKLPDVSASPKKVFAHYFGPFMISVDGNGNSGRTDYYATNYIPPTGEGGAHLATGGYFRNRPVTRPIPPGDWKQADASTNIVHAKSVGIDGFFCDIMQATQGQAYLTQYTALIAAAANYPGFLVVPMIDVNGVGAASASSVANMIAEYHGKPSTWNVNGVMIVGTFMSEGNTPAWWSGVASACQALGFSVKFVHVYNDPTNAANYTGTAYGTGTWGPGADPVSALTPRPAVSGVRSRGEKYLSPVWLQDIRTPSWYSEALNTLALTNFWDTAISNSADIIQLCTWSDFSEGSEFMNTAACGLVACDISAYYIAKLKTGAAPPILKDAIYLSYRNHVQNAPILGPQTRFMTQKPGWQTPLRYAVEALCFLTGPATVTLTVGGTSQNFSAPAGMSRFTMPPVAGNVSVTATRNSAVVVSLAPPVPIRPTLWAEDKHYFMFGSIRGTSGQFDPQMTSSGAIPVYP